MTDQTSHQSNPALHSAYYNVGYGISIPSIYFNRVLLVAALANYNHIPEILELNKAYTTQLENIGSHYVNIIVRTVDELKRIGFNVSTLPKVPDEYFQWYSDINKSVRAELKPATLEELLYTYGFELSNIMSSAAVYEWAIHMNAANAAIDHSETIKRVQEDMRNSHFRSTTVATIIGYKQYMPLYEAWQPVLKQLKTTIDLFGDNKPDTLDTITQQLQALMATCGQAHTVATKTLQVHELK